MRKLIYATYILIALGIFLVGCKDDDPTIRETTTDALINNNKPWIISGGSVTLDGDDVSNSFEGFEISFAQTTYTSSNGGDIWPEAIDAPWSFKGTDEGDASTIIRSDQIEVQIVVTKESQLLLTFTFYDVNGRINGISGNYIFDLRSGV